MAYREALRQVLAGHGDEPYQTLLHLLDDVGVRQAAALREEELRQLAGPIGVRAE